jgi:hypothetical protein
MSYPTIAHVQVISVDPQRGLIYVQVTSLGIPVPIRPLHYGQADGVRISQKPLPVPSTWGLCAFPYGDARNGIWLGSILTSLQDARTSGDPNADYEAYYSGGWQLIDGQGRHTMVYPDGSMFMVSDSLTPTVPTRHTVDQTQVQSAVPFTTAQRVPNPPSARYMVVKHATGTTLEIDTSGNVTFTGAT